MGKDLGDECRQCGPDGTPAKTLEDLYAIAGGARDVRGGNDGRVRRHRAPYDSRGLKGRERAAAKARDEYKDKTAPCVSWLFDIARPGRAV